MLTRIEFENFRGFRKLTLEGLRRVNLVVGKNNSGKTSLLEGTAALLNPVDAPLTFTKLRQLESHLQSCFASRFYSKWVVHDKSAKRSAKLSGSWGTTPWNVVLVPDQKKLSE